MTKVINNKTGSGAPDKPITRKEVMDQIESLKLECSRLIYESASVAIQSKDKVETLKCPERKEQITNDYIVLTKDLSSFKDRLNALTEQHTNVPLEEVLSPDSLFLALAMGEDYNQWINEFNVAVLPKVITLVELMEETVEEESK